jgi:hypothetical protein
MTPRASIAACLAVVSHFVIAQVASMARDRKPMSVHNRVLLNRLVVGGHRTLEVMLAIEAPRFDVVSTLIEHLGGRIRRSERSIGYVRAEVPIDKLIELVADPGVNAYQISSLSRGSWYRDGPPRDNAEMFRGFEVGPILRAAPATAPSRLPLLSPRAARQSGFTADDDAGVGEWMARHPTFDGRGVTIAFLESAQAEFGHPTLRSATALDGSEIPKLAGILNAIDPEDADETRVDLDTVVRAVTTWCRIGSRTYIVPHPGMFRFGLFTLPAGKNIVLQYGVLRDEANGETRVDTDGDADFRNERPIVDVNERYDVQTLRVPYPREAGLTFVAANDAAPHRIHIYTSGNGHQAMTVSVAAGARTEDGLAYGVAPGARVLLVRNGTLSYRLSNFLEGYLEAVRRPDVDILCDSAGITIVPDTASDFVGLFFRRLIAVYRKPIFHSAGNSLLYLNSVSSLGDVFSVGGSIGPPTLLTLFGGAAPGGMMVHPTSISGPAVDGALKPDFLAPMNRISAGAQASTNVVPLPKNRPTTQLPPGYEISCCTSASSPYSAGVAALIVSAAKQTAATYSVETLGRALRAGARFLENWPAHQQGNGVLDVSAAWREMQRSVEIPRIRVTADNVHALAPYAASGNRGVGLFEREGWRPGSRGERVLELRRESGAPGPVSYRISLTGNDGTFSAAPSVVLPLNESAPLPLHISPTSQGVHSAILNLHDPATDAIIVRAEAAIVAPARLDAPDRTARFTGSVPMMRSVAHYVTLPAGAACLSIDLEVVHGTVQVSVLQSHGIIREYYGHVLPQAGRMLTRGTYRLLLPWPVAGTWSIAVTNDSAWREPNPKLVSREDALYSMSVRILTASLAVQRTIDGALKLDVANQGAAIEEPAFDISTGTLETHRGEFSPDGLPNRFEIDVPPGAAALAFRLRSSTPATSTLELHLYDCTGGECFSYDFTVPAAGEQMLEIKNPQTGRWVAAVNAAPFPTAPGGFVLDEIVTTGVRRYPPARSVRRLPGDRWTETIGASPDRVVRSHVVPVLLCELIDAAAERDALLHPWETRKGLTNFAERSVTIGMAILPLDAEHLGRASGNTSCKASSKGGACQPETALNLLPLGFFHHALPAEIAIRQR